MMGKVIFFDEEDIVDTKALTCVKCGGKFDKNNGWFYFLSGLILGAIILKAGWGY